MNEEFLQFIWRYKYFKSSNLRTTKGEVVQIVNHGFYNSQGGPDFLSGKIQIGDELWIGHVELHVRSSEWYKHKHHLDEQYDAVVLHVVYEHDQDVYYSSGNVIPEISLMGLFDEMLYWRYEQLMAQQWGFPCAGLLPQVEDSIKALTLESSLIDRLEQKCAQLDRIYMASGGDLEQMAFVWIARGFGLPNQAEGFEKMAWSLTWNFLKRKSNDPSDSVALMLGVAGFLNAPPAEEYEFILHDKYQYLKRVYQLEEVDSIYWSFGKCRPNGFPPIRLAQLGHWCFNFHRWIAEIQEGNEQIEQLRELEMPKYWQEHYRLGLKSRRHSSSPGESFVSTLMINAWLPLRYYYYRLTDNQMGIDSVIESYGDIMPENNRIIREFEKFGWKPKNGGQSQALLSLYKSRCSLKKCLSCAIGNTIIHRKE